MCEHVCSTSLCWFWSRDWTSFGQLWKAYRLRRFPAMLCGWEHAPLSSTTQKQLHRAGISRPHGLRRSGQTAPVGWVQNAISAPDVFLRFGSATTSKFNLIDVDCMIIQCCRLFLYFWGEKILSFNHTYLIAAIGATLIGPSLSSVMVMIMRLC